MRIDLKDIKAIEEIMDTEKLISSKEDAQIQKVIKAIELFASVKAELPPYYSVFGKRHNDIKKVNEYIILGDDFDRVFENLDEVCEYLNIDTDKIFDSVLSNSTDNTASWVNLCEYPTDKWECSNCGETVYTNNNPYLEYRYCPKCGRKMCDELHSENIVKGDEISTHCYKGVVLSIETNSFGDKIYHVIDSSGGVFDIEEAEEKPVRTGKHYPQVAEFVTV